jgi:hypothetical protein
MMAYLLFAGDDYYPCGGAEDLQGRFDTLEAAVAAHDPTKYGYSGGWASVLCLESLKVAKFFNRGVWTDACE